MKLFGSETQSCTLSFDAEKLTVAFPNAIGSTPHVDLLWQDVTSALAFKRDCITTDQICIAFSTAEGGLEINEDMDGWQELISSLPSLLPGFPRPDEWWPTVAQPAFYTCITRLFAR